MKRPNDNYQIFAAFSDTTNVLVKTAKNQLAINDALMHHVITAQFRLFVNDELTGYANVQTQDFKGFDFARRLENVQNYLSTQASYDDFEWTPVGEYPKLITIQIPDSI